MTKKNTWNRQLWAIWFHGLPNQDGGFICGSTWHPTPGSGVVRSYEYEPTRALVFSTRKRARDCREAMLAKWADTSQKDWRVSVVRVRERVEVV